MPVPIIDSHIHLFAADHLDSLAWHSPSNPLGSQHSVAEYRASVSPFPVAPSTTSSGPVSGSGKTYLRGFVFLETDRVSSVSPSELEKGWKAPLDEVSYLARIARGEPLDGEGHSPADKELCLAIIPWAPVPGGPGALKNYLDEVEKRTRAGSVWKKVRGVRYLVQDKPHRTMLGAGFVEGLKWLGREGLTFDLGVDARQGGLSQLQEAVEMLKMAYEGVDESQRVKVIINHMCKPNLRLLASPELLSHPDFTGWKAAIQALAVHPTTYMKLSGLFSELPPLPRPEESSSSPRPSVASLVDRIQPWTDIVFDAFGPERVMFGSDWPVCNVGGGGNEVSWESWREVVEALLDKRGLAEGEKKGVWGGVAAKAYGIDF